MEAVLLVLNAESAGSRSLIMGLRIEKLDEEATLEE